MYKMEVVREYAGRIEYLETYDDSLSNIDEAVELAIATGGYVQVVGHNDGAHIIFEAAGRTHFNDDIGDTSWLE